MIKIITALGNPSLNTELKKYSLVFHGHFSNMKDPDSLPSIDAIYFKLPELKDCIDEICLHF